MELLSQQFCADARLDGEKCEFMREATRGMLEVICPDDISVSTWKHFALRCAMASVAMKCDVPLAKLTDMTLHSIVPSFGAAPLLQLREHPRKKILHHELHAMTRQLQSLLRWPEFQDWHPEFRVLLADLDRVIAALH